MLAINATGTPAPSMKAGSGIRCVLGKELVQVRLVVVVTALKDTEEVHRVVAGGSGDAIECMNAC
jgi:hypothetical protein